MDEQKKNKDIEEAASALIANAEEENFADKPETVPKKAKGTEEENDKKIFRKYKIKDIVFLAIITACTLITGAVMPLLVNVPLFGIVQLGLGLQFSVFPVIGMMKVRSAAASVDIHIGVPDIYVPAHGAHYRVRADSRGSRASFLPRIPQRLGVRCRGDAVYAAHSAADVSLLQCLLYRYGQ